MERPSKRPRFASFGNQGITDNDLHVAKQQNDSIFQSALEAIFEKYCQDFTGVGDEVDLQTGQIVVNNGHLEELDQDWDRVNNRYEKNRAPTESRTRGNTLLRAVTVAPEDYDTMIPSIEKHPSAQLVNAWLGETSSAGTLDEDSDHDSLLGMEEEIYPGERRAPSSSDCLSSHDSLADDAEDKDSLGASPMRSRQLESPDSLDQRDDRSISTNSLADNTVGSTGIRHKYVYTLHDTTSGVPSEPTEQKWIVPGTECALPTPKTNKLLTSDKACRPFALSGLLDSMSRVQSSNSRVTNTQSKRSRSVESDSSQDPLQE